MKVALVHDWLVKYAGAEKVLEAIYAQFPGTIHTIVHDPDALNNTPINDLRIKTSFIQRLPLAKRYYQYYLPLFPLAVEQFDLTKYNLVVSVSTCVAKGVLTKTDQVHLCYCCTPVRYGWDLYHQYLSIALKRKKLQNIFARLVLHYLRLWDIATANRVDYFVTLSEHVAKRIAKTYRRKAEVIYPPVPVSQFSPKAQKKDYYVTAARMVPYKRLDLIVEAFSQMPQKRLVIIGDGPEAKKLKKLASKNIVFKGWLPFKDLKRHISEAKAFVYAAEEDFGIGMVEAQACGTPVLAFNKGGAQEIVVNGETGILFKEQTVEAIMEVVKRYEVLKEKFHVHNIRRNSERFDTNIFQKRFTKFVSNVLKK